MRSNDGIAGGQLVFQKLDILLLLSELQATYGEFVAQCG